MEGGEDENIDQRKVEKGCAIISMRAYTKKAFAFIVIIIKRSDSRQSCPQAEHSLSQSLQLQDTTAAKTLNITPLCMHHRTH